MDERTQPCGEPVEERRTSDRAPLALTHCDLFVRKSKIQPTILEHNLKFDIFVKIFLFVKSRSKI